MVTGEMVEELILSGADIIKVGIGPGVCVCVGVRGCVCGGGWCVFGWLCVGPFLGVGTACFLVISVM